MLASCYRNIGEYSRPSPFVCFPPSLLFFCTAHYSIFLARIYKGMHDYLQDFWADGPRIYQLCIHRSYLYYYLRLRLVLRRCLLLPIGDYFQYKYYRREIGGLGTKLLPFLLQLASRLCVYSSSCPAGCSFTCTELPLTYPLKCPCD